MHAGAEELNRVYQAQHPIQASPSCFVEALGRLAPVNYPPWKDGTVESRRAFLEFTSVEGRKAPPCGVDLAAIVAWLSRELPPDAFICNGAGNYTVWVHRFFTYKQRGTELAPTSGAMGYGLPAAIAAKLRYPNRISICFAGDGCFLMYGQELGTAVQYGAPVIVIVVNNGMYGTIRMHQERRFPGRVSGTELLTPDFVGLAKSFGAYGERVETTDAFAGAFGRALASDRPALLELCVDLNQITPDHRLS